MSALMIGIAGTALSATERAWLRHPAVRGVILFTRNYESASQLQALTADIRAAAPDAIVAVDQEGGRVQRFREGFTALPALARLGEIHSRDPHRARRATLLHAHLMAAEVMAAGLDLSFAPVADLGRGNLAIGDRAFHADPAVCGELCIVYTYAMQSLGMSATLKHFPGHGSVLADTHFDRACDRRSFAELVDQDLWPFAAGISAGARAVMMAHVEYPACDTSAAGYSSYWIQQVLRQGLGYAGAVISDDIGMVAGAAVGAVAERLRLHRDAGCDLILVCQPELVESALSSAAAPDRSALRRVERLRAKPRRAVLAEVSSPAWQRRRDRLSALLEG